MHEAKNLEFFIAASSHFVIFHVRVVCLPQQWEKNLNNTRDVAQHGKWFLQRVSIACCAERCTSYSKSAGLSVRHRLVLSQNDSVPALISCASLQGKAMTLVSSWLTSA